MLSAAPTAHDSRVYAPHSTVRGQTLEQWSADWWSWAYSQQNHTSPLFDATGAQAWRGYVGKAFFLAGIISPGGAPQDVTSAHRTGVEVPTGTPVFFPVLNYELDNAGANREQFG